MVRKNFTSEQIINKLRAIHLNTPSLKGNSHAPLRHN